MCSIVGCGRPATARGWCQRHYYRWFRHGDPQLVLTGREHIKPREVRFWAKVNKNGPIPVHAPELGPCWIWIGATDGNGYGILWTDGRRERAHRLAWLFSEGVPPEPFALHHCDNPPCVRRSHLFEGDYAANVADRQAKGRQNRRPGDLRRTVPRGEATGKAAKLTTAQVIEIRKRAATETRAALGREFGVTAQQIGEIARHRSWTHIE